MDYGWIVIVGVCFVVCSIKCFSCWKRSVEHGSHGENRSAQRLLIILGSGGHTAEMFSLLQHLPRDYYSPRIYIVARTDAFSVRKATEYEKDAADYCIERIPRSREVGQSYLSSILSISHAWLYSVRILYHYGFASIVICNGPGTGVPLCLTAILVRWIYDRSLKVVFVESIARVHHLSLTGRLLYPFVDRFLIQWPYLKKAYPRAEYYGLLT
jgi:beta-1,4-N-acetylglucosaminyltransferase